MLQHLSAALRSRLRLRHIFADAGRKALKVWATIDAISTIRSKGAIYSTASVMVSMVRAFGTRQVRYLKLSHGRLPAAPSIRRCKHQDLPWESNFVVRGALDARADLPAARKL